MSHRLVFSILAAVAGLAALPAAAQFAKPDDAIEYRQSVMTVMSTHFGRLGAMANGRVPYDANAAVMNAELVATMAKLPWPAFGARYEGGKARSEVWSEPARFKEHADKLVDTTGKLLVAARAGNVEALKAAFGPAGASCKSCHDDFRKK